jgi:hypothetical protein
MTTALVLAAAVAAVLVWPARPTPRIRLHGIRRRARPPAPGQAIRPGLAVIGALAVAAALLAGTPPWVPVLAAGGAVSVAVRRSRRKPDDGDVALLVDLLASCLAAGVAPADAVLATSAAVPGTRSRSLVVVGDRLRAGDQPVEAWAEWLDDPVVAPVARACARGSASGAAVADELGRAAARIRAARAAAAQRRVAAAGVWVVLPLGLCFLPAFVLVGVVPIAVGLIEQLT